MKALVTGAAGRLGRWVVKDLAAAGWQVVAVDRAPAPPADWPAEPAVTYRRLEIHDAGRLSPHIAGCTALVHLAAIPTPTLGTREEVFLGNTRAAFVALEAAAVAGVSKAAIASSTSAYGMAFAEPAFAPLYLPIDEEHPLISADAYALSKEATESMGRMFHRTAGMSVAALRFHWVAAPGDAAKRAAAAESDTEFQIRRQWGWVDARDAAVACRLAIETDGLGFEAFNIVAPDALSEQPIEALLERHLPGVLRRRPLAGTDSPFCSAKARRMLGWEAKYRWRTQ